jgi:hypothetical protein
MFSRAIILLAARYLWRANDRLTDLKLEKKLCLTFDTVGLPT